MVSLRSGSEDQVPNSDSIGVADVLVLPGLRSRLTRADEQKHERNSDECARRTRDEAGAWRFRRVEWDGFRRCRSFVAGCRV